MPFSQQVTFFSITQSALLVFLVVNIAISCTIPKKYQSGKPFIYKTTVTLNSDQKGSEKLFLRDRLTNQVDDSLQVRTVLSVGFPELFFYRLLEPPVFDTIYMDRSKTFMSGLLHSLGYFNPVITDTFRIDTVIYKGDQQMRAKVVFFVTPGKQYRLDSIGYDINDEELQMLALQNREQSLLKKNEPFSVEKISAELDRLLNIYRNNGYYRISKEDLYAERDTVVAALIDPTLDPFEQLQLLDSLQRKRENPTINVTIKQRLGQDSSHLVKYYVGDVTVYPDLKIIPDSLQAAPQVTTIDEYRIVHSERQFKLPFIARNIALRKGQLYQQDNYFRTLNNFSNLGAWQQVDIDFLERMDSLPLLDASIRLYPAKKLTLNIDFETSRNATDVVTTGSLFGIGLNVGLTNRNAFRESIQTNSTVRFGVELGTRVVQTVQTGFSHNIIIPRFLKPFHFLNRYNFNSSRSRINFNTAYTNRRLLFILRSVNASFGVDGTKRNHTWQYVPFNFEYGHVIGSDSLTKLQIRFPWLKQAFNTGLIIGQVFAYDTRTIKDNKLNFFRARLEESGAVFGLIKKLDTGTLRRFLRLDAEFKHFINYPKSSLAFRIFGGYGYIYGRSGDTLENNLPFFKAFFAGGPYTMRAWQIRQLGPGSSRIYEDSANIDRFGDIQLEANIEYRFNIATLFGVKLKSALFADIGNIWAEARDKDGKEIKEAQFSFSRLYRDLAVGAGTSLRFDFDFFLIRLDWAYKIKNPVYSNVSNGWFQNLKLKQGQFQLGIGYPF